MLFKLKVQSAPDVDMECFDGNVLEYHYFMVLFREVFEEDSRGRLTRLIKYTVGDFMKHYIQFPSNEGFSQVKYLLEKMYDDPHRQAKFQALLAVAIFMFKIEFWVKNARP